MTLELIKHETKNKIKITRNYSDLPPIKCYPNMLNQVFMNLLINACQSMKNGGDNRAYIFDVSAVSELYYEGFSIHKKFLEQLPYNEIHKGIFSFDNIITRSELYKIIGR